MSGQHIEQPIDFNKRTQQMEPSNEPVGESSLPLLTPDSASRENDFFEYDLQSITQCAEAITKLLDKMVLDLSSFRSLLFSTFAISFLIPLSPVTPQIAKLRLIDI